MIGFVLSVSGQRRDYEGHAIGDNPPGSNTLAIDSATTVAGERTLYDGADTISPVYKSTHIGDFDEALRETDAYKAAYEPWKLMGSDVVAIPFGVPMFPTSLSNISAANNISYGAAYYLFEPTNTTGIRAMQGAAGVYTATKFNGFALYKFVNDTIIVVDSTVNDGNIWKTSYGNAITKTWTNGPHTLAPGIYCVHAIYNTSDTASTAATVATHSSTGTGMNAVYNLVSAGEVRFRYVITSTDYPAARYPKTSFVSSAFTIHGALYYTAP